MLEVIQTAAQVIAAGSITFYVLDKRVIFNANFDKREKELLKIISNCKYNTKVYKQTLDNMNYYQEKLKLAQSENTRLVVSRDDMKASKDKIELQHRNMLERINKIGIKEYENGNRI